MDSCDRRNAEDDARSDEQERRAEHARRLGLVERREPEDDSARRADVSVHRAVLGATKRFLLNRAGCDAIETYWALADEWKPDVF